MTSVRNLADLEEHPHANVFPEAEPHTIRLELDAGEGVAAHSHPDRDIVCYLREGALKIAIGDETHHLTAGDIARFDGDQEIAPEAVTDSSALIVLAHRCSSEGNRE